MQKITSNCGLDWIDCNCIGLQLSVVVKIGKLLCSSLKYKLFFLKLLFGPQVDIYSLNRPLVAMYVRLCVCISHLGNNASQWTGDYYLLILKFRKTAYFFLSLQ